MGAADEPIRPDGLIMVYQRVLKLPCDDIRSGIAFKSTLDAGLKQLVSALFKPADGFKIHFRDDTGGHLWAVVTRGAHKIEVEGHYGQNSNFADGKKHLFVSYTIRAEGAFGTTNIAENSGEGAELLGKIAGVVLSVVLAYAICSRIPNRTAMFILAIPIFAAFVYAGIWFGRKFARMIGSQLQPGAGDGVLSGNDMAKANAVWKRLTSGIESVTSGYPTA